jgi:hypothetical protein
MRYLRPPGIMLAANGALSARARKMDNMHQTNRPIPAAAAGKYSAFGAGRADWHLDARHFP